MNTLHKLWRQWRCGRVGHVLSAVSGPKGGMRDYVWKCDKCDHIWNPRTGKA